MWDLEAHISMHPDAGTRGGEEGRDWSLCSYSAGGASYWSLAHHHLRHRARDLEGCTIGKILDRLTFDFIGAPCYM